MKEVSVVIPCLNEEKTIGICIKKIHQILNLNSIDGEIIVVDNGSTDNSSQIAKGLGANVIYEERKGYGNALRKGIEVSQGKFVIIGDGDNTYDFLEIPKFIEKLKEGYDLVMGSRFKGKIFPGAMSWSHRYIGNPILSSMLRFFFGGNVSDAHCGLRAFTKEAYKKMNLHTTGMEFASEMVIHGLKKKLKIAEVPINYYTREGESKLSSFRDAWRHIRFMLLYSPGYVFLLPGFFIFFINMIISLRLLFSPIIFLGRPWDIHVMVFSSMFTVLGWQVINIGITAKIFAYQIALEKELLTERLLSVLTLERTLLVGFILILIGISMIGYIIYIWAKNNFGDLYQVKTGIFAFTLVIMGLQTIFTAFLSSMLSIKYR